MTKKLENKLTYFSCNYTAVAGREKPLLPVHPFYIANPRWTEGSLAGATPHQRGALLPTATINTYTYPFLNFLVAYFDFLKKIQTFISQKSGFLLSSVHKNLTGER